VLWKFYFLALTFINPMLLRPSQVLPRGEQWRYDQKFDGFRGMAIKNGKDVLLWSSSLLKKAHF